VPNKVPRNVPGVLSAAEAEAAAELILSQRAGDLIHVSTQAGPLPFLTYGPYWGYHQYEKAYRPFDTAYDRVAIMHQTACKRKLMSWGPCA